MKIVLIGGYPKGFEEPFHIKTRSGKILHKITDQLQNKPIFFDLWENKEEEDARILTDKTKSALNKFVKNSHKLIALGRYIEEVLVKNNFMCEYLPHPASRDKKFVLQLEKGLLKIDK
jgi:hypothetical protein